MGTATHGGKGFKVRTRVSGERPISTASFKQQFSQALCQPTPPSSPIPVPVTNQHAPSFLPTALTVGCYSTP